MNIPAHIPHHITTEETPFGPLHTLHVTCDYDTATGLIERAVSFGICHERTETGVMFHID